MLKYKQLVCHDPDNGAYGDCWRTAIACMLEIPVAHVPHVYKEGNVDDGFARMNHWLKSTHQLQAVEIPLRCTLEEAQIHALAMFGSLHYYLLGHSSAGCGHVVVCRRGKIVWDPSVHNTGIVGPTDDGLYWLGVLVRVL